MLYKNPIIPGYNPDPSICRVGDDFYLVNSTFEFFPGVPIYHSKNLVNWELIGYCLTRRSQLELEGCRNSGGIYAPTIRHHDGTFYMITTNVTNKGNFIVHTNDIRGEWSEPAWIDQGGIDPSLFWDDDGRCYYCSTGILDGVRGIVAFEINPMTGEILSDKKLISEGCGGQCAEGPHIYKKDNYYYLFIAEGGTEYAHRETAQRSKNVFGPYTPCPHNPIISHKEYKKSEIQATGHADLVDDANGNWWLVFLGIRRFSHALLHNLGRETFLAPVTWDEEGWPVVGYNGNGTVELVMDAPLPGCIPASTPYIIKDGDALANPSLFTKGGHIYKNSINSNENNIITAEAAANSVIGKEALVSDHSIHIDFNKDELDLRLQYTRNPEYSNYIHNPASGSLTLKGTNISLNEPGKSPTVLSFKQPEFTTTLTAAMNIAGTNARRSGIAAYYNNDYHYEIYIGSDSHGKYIGFYKHIHDMGAELARIPLDSIDNNSEKNAYVLFRIDTDREGYTFSYAVTDTCNTNARVAFQPIGSGLNAGLSTEGTRTMTFTGTLFSLFAEEGDGVFENMVDLIINPDVDYKL